MLKCCGFEQLQEDNAVPTASHATVLHALPSSPGAHQIRDQPSAYLEKVTYHALRANLYSLYYKELFCGPADISLHLRFHQMAPPNRIIDTRPTWQHSLSASEHHTTPKSLQGFSRSQLDSANRLYDLTLPSEHHTVARHADLPFRRGFDNWLLTLPVF